MKNRFSVKDLSCVAIFTALLTVCSWMSIPAAVPFTMQTFAVFLSMGLLGGRRGTMTVFVYILLAAAGAPVLSGFSGGLGALFGSTGGYVFGFLLSALFLWGVEKIWGRGMKVFAISSFFGMVLYNLSGTLWYVWVYSKTQGPLDFITALLWCVAPFLLSDFLKIIFALSLTARLRPYIK